MRHVTWVATLAMIFVFDLRHASAEDDTASPRAVLAISSKPAASPKSPAVLADTTFTASATGTGSVTYTWDFGDGTPQGSGASVFHDYSAAGTYNAVLTVSDTTGATLSSPLVVVVTDVVKSPKLYITLYFKKPGVDTISLQGQLRLPPDIKLEGQLFVVTVGGVTGTFTLNAFGQAANGPGNSIKLFVKRRSNSADGLNSQFTLNLKGDFQSTLASNANLTNRDADREPVKVKVAIAFDSISYSAAITQEFDAIKGVKGITR